MFTDLCQEMNTEYILGRDKLLSEGREREMEMYPVQGVQGKCVQARKEGHL